MASETEDKTLPQRIPGYFRLCWDRAWEDAEPVLFGKTWPGIITAGCIAVASFAIQSYMGRRIDMVILVSSLVAGVIGYVAFFLLYLFFSFLAAPARIHRDDQKKVAELKKALEQNVAALRADFAQTFHSYADARADLWSILDIASARQLEVEIDSGSVRESMKEVEFPEDILDIRQNDSLYEYARTAVEQWNDKKKEFLEFCLMLYQQQGDSPILNLRELRSLDDYRRDLAKFWDEWERRCNGQGMSVGDIVGPDLIQSQTPDIVMLTYLEIARGLHKKENSRGKQGLFTVAKDFREFSNS